ncbi:MAG: type II toxin-antitoxin system Phd/YefM family antitoxin [Oscillochloridaceae bacterium umkhey_bin13]
MSRIWQLQEAKNKFSEVVEQALNHGPQIVTKRGVEAVIVMSYDEYQQLLFNQQKLSAFFQASPLCDGDEELVFTRDTRPARDDFAL